jgi:succinoglycan biosynthesis transport protein ExoP
MTHPLEPGPLSIPSGPERGTRSAELSESSMLRAPNSTPEAPAALSAPPSVETLWHALHRRWAPILVLGLLAGGLGAAVAWLLVPGAYTVQTLLQMNGRKPHNALEGEGDVAGFQRAQAALFTSYPVLHAALTKPEVAQLPLVQAQADPFEWLTKNLKTDVLLGPEILRVTLSGDRGEDVALVLNEVTRAYLKECAGKEEAKILERIKQVEANFKKASDALRDKRQKLADREAATGIEDPETTKTRITAAMTALAAAQSQKLHLSLSRKEAETELAAFQAKVKEPDKIVITDFAVVDELKNDPILATQHARMVQLETRIGEWMRLSPTGAPGGALKGYQEEMRSIRERINNHIALLRPSIEARLRSKIVEEAKGEIAKLERKLGVLARQEESLKVLVQKQEQEVKDLQSANRRMDTVAMDIPGLRDEVAQLDVVLKKIGDELGTLQAELPVPAPVTPLEWAKAPLTKKRDRQLKFAIGAFLGPFALVFLGVALWEFRARRVYHSGDVAQGLGLDLLGTLPPVPAGARVVVPVDGSGAEHGALMEAVDGVRTRLLHAARNHSVRVLMVASAIGGEGKTSLATHLAASLARGGRKTLLVDADLRNPGAHLPFNCRLAPGFAEALRGEAAYEDLMQPTPVENLWLLSAGMGDRRAVQALGKEDLGKVFERFKAEFDFVVVDVCPVLPVPDALLIGQHADAALFAVLRNVSRLPAVHAAQQRLSSVEIPTLGAVVVGEAVQTYGIDRYAALSSEDKETRRQGDKETR